MAPESDQSIDKGVMVFWNKIHNGVKYAKKTEEYEEPTNKQCETNSIHGSTEIIISRSRPLMWLAFIPPPRSSSLPRVAIIPFKNMLSTCQGHLNVPI